MTARGPIGSLCTLRADEWDGDPPESGDYLRTDGGSVYLIDKVRPRPGGRYLLDCLRWNAELVIPGRRVIDWTWASRDPR